MASRRGLVVPQNTFLERIIKTASGAHEHFLLGSAKLIDCPIVYCSNGFTDLTGYKKANVVKKKANCSFMYGSLTTKDAVRELRNALRDKTPTHLEIIFYKKDGTPFWVLLKIDLIHGDSDDNVLFIVTFQDISAFKEPINPSYRKHRWTEFNKALNTKFTPDNPISKAKEEKNRIFIGELMDNMVNELPEYRQDIPKTPWYVVLHCSTPKVVWDWFILIFILYTATSVPFIVCFDYDSLPMTIADSIVDFMFLIDILLNFHTSYMDDESCIVLDLKRIRRRYLRGWFAIDLITSLPYGVLSLALPDMGKAITNFISFLKAIRLLRLNRVVRALDQYLEYGFITLILWMLFFCLCSHWMACIFYAIADHYDKFAEIGWVRTMSEATSQPLIINMNGTIIAKPTLASLYMSSLYFSLTSLTSIGFGNIAPNTTAEKIFSCITMIFGGLCYAVIFGQVTAIVQQSQKKSESYHQTLENMRSFCKLYKVPNEIATRIIDYYMYNWSLSKGVDTNQVLQHCPKDLQSDICIHLNKKIIDNTPAFGELSNAVLRSIARNFGIHRVAPGERIVHEGESLDVLYFVASGSFEITHRGNVVGLLGEGDVFGDDVCRHNDVGKSSADVFALTYGDIHAIGRDELLSALSFYPEYGSQFAKVFRVSYNLRAKASPNNYSNLLGVKPPKTYEPFDQTSRRHSLIDEMHSNFDVASTGLGLDTPGSQNMTDTDPPSKPFVFAKTAKTFSPPDGMKAISESSEVNDSGMDEDFRQWNDFQTSKENKEELFKEITGMKSEVRREIEMMGGKMSHLEANIATILDLLKGKELAPNRQEVMYPLTPVRITTSSCSKTAQIIDRAKAEFPEEILPDWVEMENFGMEAANNAHTSNIVVVNHENETKEVTGKKRNKEEKSVENQEHKENMEEDEGEAKPSKKSKQKKKGLKNKRKSNENKDETHLEDKVVEDKKENRSSATLGRDHSGKSVREEMSDSLMNSEVKDTEKEGILQTQDIQEESKTKKKSARKREVLANTAEKDVDIQQKNDDVCDKYDENTTTLSANEDKRDQNTDESQSTLENAASSHQSLREEKSESVINDEVENKEKESMQLTENIQEEKPKGKKLKKKKSKKRDVVVNKAEENVEAQDKNDDIPEKIDANTTTVTADEDKKENDTEKIDDIRPSSGSHYTPKTAGSSHQSLRRIPSNREESSNQVSGDDKPLTGKELNSNDGEGDKLEMVEMA